VTSSAAEDRPRRRRSAFADAAALRHFELELLEPDIQLPPPFAAEPAGPPRPSAHADGAARRRDDDAEGTVLDLPLPSRSPSSAPRAA
jgi:hypothetical protein